MSKILVVDDEPMVLNLVRTLLWRQGRQVLVAGRGRLAIDMFKEERPDMTILDLNMPDMNGLEVLKRIRAINPCAQVMVFTGAGTEAEERQARALGVTEFLRKGTDRLILANRAQANQPAPGGGRVAVAG